MIQATAAPHRRPRLAGPEWGPAAEEPPSRSRSPRGPPEPRLRQERLLSCRRPDRSRCWQSSRPDERHMNPSPSRCIELLGAARRTISDDLTGVKDMRIRAPLGRSASAVANNLTPRYLVSPTP